MGCNKWFSKMLGIQFSQPSRCPIGSFVNISAGYSHTCGIKIEVLFNVGDETTVKFTSKWHNIKMSLAFHVWFKTDGTVRCWGIDSGSSIFGQVTDTPLVPLLIYLLVGPTLVVLK